jgi:Divergent InlB B-repeat domain
MKRKGEAPPRIGGRLGRIAVLALCALCVALVGSATASAAAPTLRGTFDCSGTPDTSCGVDKAAVDLTSGDVYVIDNAHDVVNRFDSAGTYVSQIRGSDTTARTFAFTAGDENVVAVDNSGGADQGNVYVVSEAASFGTGSAVFAFDSSGTELWERQGLSHDTCGVGVDANGNPWIADYIGQTVAQLRVADGGLTGTSVSTVSANTNPCEIAFDASNDMYVNSWHNRLDKYDSNGALLTTLDPGPVLDVATDLTTGDVYAVTNGGTQVSEWDAAGNPVSGTPFDTGSTSLTGVAVNGASRLAYVSDVGNGDVQVFDLPPLHTLSVTANGTGGGSVTADSGAIATCTRSSGTCSGVYEDGTVVRLTATPAAHTTLNWTGCDSVAGNVCTVTVNADAGVTATFTTIQHRVTAAKNGTGSGSVSSAPAGISCGATCSALFDEGSSVTLTATPAANSTFTGWSGGGCSGTATCRVTVNADATVTATFAQNAPAVTTGGASSATQTGATVSGTVNPNGANVSDCHFQYGTTTAYGSVAACGASPGAGTSAAGVSAALSGLAAGTTYHYRLVATNGGGTTNGADATFSTSSPAAPSGCPADASKCNARLVLASHSATVRGSTATIKVSCTGDQGGTCRGSATFKATLKVKVKKGKKTVVKKKVVVVGKITYDLAVGAKASRPLKLSSAARSALKKGALVAKAAGLDGSVKFPRAKARKKHKHKR